MKKFSNINFWFRSHLYKGVVYEKSRTAFREYHVSLNSGIPGINPNYYYFIEGYDGSLQLNKSPLSYDEKELLSEIAGAVKNALMLHSNELIVHSDHSCIRVKSPAELSSTPSAAA